MPIMPIPGAPIIKSTPPLYCATGAGNIHYTTGSFTFTINIAADDKILCVGVHTASDNAVTVAVKIGASTGLTEMAHTYPDAGMHCYTNIYYLLNPASGTQTVTVTITGAVYIYTAANGVTYKNVTSVGSLLTNNGSTTSCSLSASSSTSSRVFQIFGTSSAQNGPTTAFTNYNQTSRWNQPGVTNMCKSTVIGDAAGAADLSFTATACEAVGWGAAGLPLNS